MSTWWRKGVVYQIYPRSFMDANGDGVGDLAGILHRLDYLASLGVDAVWISPIYPSPMADFGYDVSNYTDIDPLFGTMADFDALLAGLHARGLRLILDFVPNHTSDQHPWFMESAQDRSNPRHDWYIWRDPAPDGGPPNNWVSIFGGPAWTYHPARGQYYLHIFLKEQPDLNWRNPSVKSAMFEALRFWLDKGVDGFRLDVIPNCFKHPAFPNNPPSPDASKHASAWEWERFDHLYDSNQPEIHGLIRDLRALVESYAGERVLIGETHFDDPHILARFYGADDELHLPFNFQLTYRPWDAPAFRAVLSAYYAALPAFAQPNFVLGSHDVHRLATRFGPQNAHSAALLLLTLRGTPTLYYGDELGMEDVPIPPEKARDPHGLGVPNMNLGRDPQRTPMPWDASPNAGFSPAGVETWLPLSADYQKLNVAAQNNDPASTLAYYRGLLALRRAIPALHAGALTLLESPASDALAYLRTSEGECLLIVLNFRDKSLRLDFSSLGQAGTLLYQTRLPYAPRTSLALAGLDLPPHAGYLLSVPTA
jgi:glycosidase